MITALGENRLQFRSDAADQQDISVHHWLPADSRAVLIIAHGAAEHGARYARVASAMNDAGYAVYAPDHRGHGLTGSAAGSLGVFADGDGWNTAVADLKTLVSHARSRHPGLPLALMGHSMGSFMVQQFIGEYGDMIDAVVLSGSTELGNFDELAPLLTAEAEQNGRNTASAIMSEMMGQGFNSAFDGDGATGYEWLSRDPEEVAAYIADPLCGFELSTGAWLDMIASNRIPVGPGDFGDVSRALPIYLMAGEHDPVNLEMAGLHGLEAIYRNSGFSNITKDYYREGRHELLNDINRDAVTANLKRWLDTALELN